MGKYRANGGMCSRIILCVVLRRLRFRFQEDFFLPDMMILIAMFENPYASVYYDKWSDMLNL